MRNIYLFLSLIVFISCSQNNSTADKPVEQLMDSVYTISGVANNADSGSVVVLQFLGTDKAPDTAIINGNKFEFKGVANEALVADLYIPQESHEPIIPLKIIVENTVINIEGDANSIIDANVIAGISNKDFNTLKKLLRVVEDSMEQVGISAEEASINNDSVNMQRLHSVYFNLTKERSRIIKQFAREHPKNIGGAYYASTEYNYTQAELDSIYYGFDSTIKNNLYVKQIKEGVEAFKRTAIGQAAPDFEMKNVNGKNIELSSFKGNYVFVDFWASWCGPCRADNPNIVKAFQRFKNNDFQILGVSLDEDRQEWLAAIKKDKLTWQHVTDLKGWQSNVVPLYGIRAIPANFLLDKDGKIIARDLHGAQLEKKLQEVFK